MVIIFRFLVAPLLFAVWFYATKFALVIKIPFIFGAQGIRISY